MLGTLAGHTCEYGVGDEGVPPVPVRHRGSLVWGAQNVEPGFEKQQERVGREPDAAHGECESL